MPMYRVSITYREIVEQYGVCLVDASTEDEAIIAARERDMDGLVEFKATDGNLVNGPTYKAEITS